MRLSPCVEELVHDWSIAPRRFRLASIKHCHFAAAFPRVSDEMQNLPPPGTATEQRGPRRAQEARVTGVLTPRLDPSVLRWFHGLVHEASAPNANY